MSDPVRIAFQIWQHRGVDEIAVEAIRNKQVSHGPQSVKRQQIEALDVLGKDPPEVCNRRVLISFCNVFAIFLGHTSAISSG